MAREPHAWFRQQTGWWMTTINHEKIKLVKGKEKKTAAQKKLRELLTMRDHNPSPESGALTVAAIIDLYLVTTSAGKEHRLYMDMYYPENDPAKQPAPKGFYKMRRVD